MASRLARISALFVSLGFAVPAAATSRIKDLATVQGVRENPLFGYGLVVGLGGTGDDQQVLFTAQSLGGMLGRLGIRIDPQDMRFRNVAAVMVTASLPTFTRPGARLDVSVSALGTARSLEGGVLLVTPLAGADGTIYAVAQGAVQVGAYQIAAAGSLLRKNQPNSGRVPGGANVERAVAPDLTAGPLVFQLKTPDFTTAARIAVAINKLLGKGAARAVDPAAVEVLLPGGGAGGAADGGAVEAQSRDDAGVAVALASADGGSVGASGLGASPGDGGAVAVLPSAVELVERIERLEVEADGRARVAISERTGTIVAGENVRLRPVVVAQGGLQISVQSRPQVSQPNAFGAGQTVVTREAQIGVNEQPNVAVALPSSTTVTDLAKAMNALGVSARDLVAILQAIKTAGALDADLEVF